MNVGGVPPNGPAGTGGPGPAGSSDADDLLAARADWQSSLVATQLMLVEHNRSRRTATRDLQLTPNDAMAQAAAFIGASEIRVLDPATQALSLADIDLIRFTYSEGQNATDIADRTGRPLFDVLATAAQLRASLSIRSPQDWVPVLSTIVATGRMSAADCARAVINLSSQPGFGPARPWQRVIDTMVAAGLPADEADTVHWHLACGQQQLDRDERALLVSLTGAPGAVTPGQDASELTRNVQASLAAKLGADDGKWAQDQRANIVANVAWTRLLPPGADPATVAAACMQVDARRRGIKLDTAQAALLLDLRAGRSEAELFAIHGEDFTALAGRTWQALGVPGYWIGAREAGPLIDRADELLLFSKAQSGPAQPMPPVEPTIALVPSGPAAPVFNGEPLAQSIIAAAPTLSADEMVHFKEMYVDRISVRSGTRQAFRNTARSELNARLGGPETILAAAAKAANTNRLTRDDLFKVQQYVAAERLGLHKSECDALVPLAGGCTPAQAGEWLGTHNFNSTLSRLQKALGTGGVVTDLLVRQAIVDAAFAEGLMRAPTTIPETPPADLTPLLGPRAGRPDLTQTVFARPLTDQEIAAAPSVPAEYRDNFKTYTVSEQLDVQWSANGGLKRAMLKALGNPDPRGIAAIAAKAMDEGHLTRPEFEKAQRWTVLQTCGLSKADGRVLNGLAAGLKESEVAVAEGATMRAVRAIIQRAAALLDPPFAVDGRTLPAAIVKLVRANIAFPIPPAAQPSPLLPLSRAEIDAAPTIQPADLQTYKNWKVERLNTSEWPQQVPVPKEQKKALVQAWDHPDLRGELAIAAKAAEQGQITLAEFTKAKRLIAADLVGLNPADLLFLDSLRDIGDFDGTAAFLGVPKSNFLTRYNEVSNAIGYSGSKMATGAADRFLQAAFDRGLLLEPPKTN